MNAPIARARSEHRNKEPARRVQENSVGSDGTSSVAVDPPSLRSSLFPIDAASALVHDLRSPLGALTINLEFALSELPEAAEYDHVRETLHDCRLAGARLSRTVTNLLDIVRGERGKLSAQRVPVSVQALLQSIAYANMSDPRAHQVLISTECDEGEFELDPDLMVRVLNCLIDAALSGAHAGAAMSLSARLHDGELELSLPTLGSHLSSEHSAVAFSTSARSVEGCDLGLSLYFCRLAVAAHGGSIGLHEGKESVTSYRIVLPARLCET